MSIPIEVRGNYFWHADERFLIKGISYFRRGADDVREFSVDTLSEDCIEDLKRDIDVFRELGLNTVRVANLSPGNDHSKALQILSEAGLYVLVDLVEKVKTPEGNMANPDQDFDAARFYLPFLVKNSLALVHQLADHPNVLGFLVNAERVRSSSFKMVEVYRAAVRDIKTCLRIRGGRVPPVGVTTSFDLAINPILLQYFTAGSSNERVDFYALNHFGWANRSSFRVSGWQTLVENFQSYPLPLFLSKYGAVTGKERVWEEVECLYSPDMTGVFSGGCLHTYCESNSGHGYDIVKISTERKVEKRREFEALKRHFHVVNSRTKEELFGTNSDVKDYEGWTGQFPQSARWRASNQLPPSPIDVEGTAEQLKAERQKSTDDHESAEDPE